MADPQNPGTPEKNGVEENDTGRFTKKKRPSGFGKFSSGSLKTMINKNKQLFSRKEKEEAPQRSGIDFFRKRGSVPNISNSQSSTSARSSNGPLELIDDKEMEGMTEVEKLRYKLAQKDAQIENLLNEKALQSTETDNLMTQLSEFSQKYADSSMREQTAVHEVARLKEEAEEIIVQRDTYHNSLKELTEQYRDLKSGVVFEKVQENQKKIEKYEKKNKELKMELRELSKERDELKDLFDQLQADFKSHKEDRRDLHEQLKSIRETINTKDSEKMELQDKMDDIISQKENIMKALERSQKEHEANVKQLKEEHELEIAERDNRVISATNDLEQEFAQLKAERNGWKRKAESISKDLRKIRRSQSKGDQDEIMRMQQLIGDLQEQLDRKNKSLADCMEALGTPTIIEAPRKKPPPPLQPHPSTRKNHPRHPPFTSENELLREKNRNLQTLANELSETIQGKEEVLRSLRYANSYLGNRLLVLEKQFGTGPELDSSSVAEEHFFFDNSSIKSESLESTETDEHKHENGHDLP